MISCRLRQGSILGPEMERVQPLPSTSTGSLKSSPSTSAARSTRIRVQVLQSWTRVQVRVLVRGIVRSTSVFLARVVPLLKIN